MIDARRLTDRSRRVLTLAESQATRFRKATVEPEHLLLALAEEGKGVAANVLRRAGVEFEQLKSVLEAIVPISDGSPIFPLSWSERAEQIVAHAHDEGRPMNHNYVGTEHLLLAISLQTDGVIPLIFAACAIQPQLIRRETYELLGHGELAAAVDL